MPKVDLRVALLEQDEDNACREEIDNIEQYGTDNPYWISVYKEHDRQLMEDLMEDLMEMEDPWDDDFDQ